MNVLSYLLLIVLCLMEYHVLIFNSHRNVIVHSRFRAYSSQELKKKLAPIYERYMKILVNIDPLAQFKVNPNFEITNDSNYPLMF